MRIQILFPYITLITLILCFQIYAALPEVPKDPQAALMWQDKRLSQIKEFQNSSQDEMIAGVGEMIRELKTLNYRSCDERDYVVSQAQSILMSIPGHAEYYAKQIEVARAKDEAENKHQVALGYGPSSTTYDRYRMGAFETLANLPSAETVKVLGEFLYDERDYQEVSPTLRNDDIREFGTNAGAAAAALSNLRIDFQRTKQDAGKPHYLPVETWKLWYEQVKAGTRTFRFEGDPHEYNLSGPVGMVMAAPVTDHSPKHQAVPDKKGIDKAAASPFYNIGLLAACLGIMAAVGYFIRAKSRVS